MVGWKGQQSGKEDENNIEVEHEINRDNKNKKMEENLGVRNSCGNEMPKPLGNFHVGQPSKNQEQNLLAKGSIDIVVQQDNESHEKKEHEDSCVYIVSKE